MPSLVQECAHTAEEHRSLRTFQHPRRCSALVCTQANTQALAHEQTHNAASGGLLPDATRRSVRVPVYGQRLPSGNRPSRVRMNARSKPAHAQATNSVGNPIARLLPTHRSPQWASRLTGASVVATVSTVVFATVVALCCHVNLLSAQTTPPVKPSPLLTAAPRFTPTPDTLQPPSPGSPTDPLRQNGQILRVTRAEAIRLALAQNPTLAVAREQTAQARARLRQAVEIPEPTFGASLLGQPGVLHPHQGSETDLGVGITIPFPTKFKLRAQAARGEIGQYEATYGLQRYEIVVATNEAYDSLLVSLMHRRDLEEAKRLTQDFLTRTQARFNAGTVPKLDVIKAQVSVAQAENDLIANERGVASARTALNRLLARVLGAPIEAADSLEVPDAVPELQSLMSLAMDNREELRGLEAARAGARASERLAKQYYLPDVGLSVSRNNIYGNPLEYSTGISFGIPFPWQHNRGELAELRSRQREIEAQYRDVLGQVQQDLGDAYANATIALRQVVYLRDELLPSARDAYRAVAASYSLGGSSSLEVIDAQRTLLDAQTQYATALGAVNDAAANLERAVGAPLSSVSNARQGSPR